jgi:hypothetical protein
VKVEGKLQYLDHGIEGKYSLDTNRLYFYAGYYGDIVEDGTHNKRKNESITIDQV